MNKHINILPFGKAWLGFLTLVLVACGPDSKHFAIDGHFLNLNQGEFLVYSPDGAMASVDTIYVEGGRFDYEGNCIANGTAIVIMPNGQQIPVFISPGKSYSIKGDAQNLKGVIVKGGDDNKLMNQFRNDIADIPATRNPVKQVSAFVKANPGLTVSSYLIRHYLLEGSQPDYATAASLLDIMLKENKDDASLTVLRRKVGALKSVSKGCSLPSFSISDINGKTISSGQMSSGTWIICSFATWDFDSTNMLRRIKGVKADKSADWHIVGISLDASKVLCRNSMSYDMSEYTIICDEKMTETPLAEQLCLSRTGIAIIVKNGKIVERNLTGEPLYKYLRGEC